MNEDTEAEKQEARLGKESLEGSDEAGRHAAGSRDTHGLTAAGAAGRAVLCQD